MVIGCEYLCQGILFKQTEVRRLSTIFNINSLLNYYIKRKKKKLSKLISPKCIIFYSFFYTIFASCTYICIVVL